MRIYSLIDSQTLMTKGFASEVMRHLSLQKMGYS
jgi:hypothetical protein